MKIYIVGIGVDGEKTLTKEAKNAIDSSELLIGAKRMAEPFLNLNKEVFYSYLPNEISDKINSTDALTVSVLMSGDSSFFSGTKKLLEKLDNCDVEIISGISSMSYFCGKLGISYENMKFVSLHGVESNIAVNVKLNEKCFFLLGGKITPSDICKSLIEYSLDDVQIYIGENLGYESEKIVSGRPKDYVSYNSENLSVMIIENKHHLKFTPVGINDEDFIREKTPMTKSIIRSSIISRLNIGNSDICWDIGCGSGSVTVEMAFQCCDGKVYAFDKNHDAVSLTEKNLSRFSCDNAKIIEGNCPEILSDIPSPDKVFIGGSSGSLSGIFGVIKEKNPCADIVITAVTLETLNNAVSVFDEYNGEYDVVQIAVTNTKRAGRYNLFQAENPVFLIKGKIK